MKLHMTASRSQEQFYFWMLVTPCLIGFLWFTAGPMAVSLWWSFTTYNVIDPPVWLGFDNYSYLVLHDPAFWPSVRVTVVYTVFAVPGGLLISTAVALLLNQPVRSRALLRTIYFLPTILPAAASAVIWVWIFSPTGGLLNNMLESVGIRGPAWTHSPHWALPAMIIMSLWGFGGAMVIVLARLQDVPRQLYEAAMLDGANAWQRFRHVTLPQISPVLFFNLVMGTIGAMKVFDQAFMFGAASGQVPGGPARATLFYVLNLYQKAFTYFHFGLASAMAWMLFAAILAITLFNFYAAKRWVHYEN